MTMADATDRSSKTPPSLILERLAVALGASLVLALLLTWGDTGALFDGGPWLEAMGARWLQLFCFGAVIALQRIGLLTGIVAGVLLAFAMVVLFEGQMASYYWIGTFFLHALKMIIVPLVIFAMITGITGLGDVRKLGRLGGRTLLYFGVTTLIAVVLGAVLVNLMQPGAELAVPTDLKLPERIAAKGEMGLPDIMMSFLSENIVKSFAELQMLPTIVFSLVFGAVLTTLGERGKTVIAFCDGANEAMMKIVHIVMLLAPIGVYALVAGRFGVELEKNGAAAFFAQLESIGLYGLTVVLGLAIHGAIVLPLFLRFMSRHHPARFVRGMGGSLLTAFSTASSAATMPLTMECLEDNNKVDKRAVQFVVPLGATVNMNGTALYEAVAAITIAQAFGIELTIGQQLVVVITATLAAIGAAGIPEAGLVTMVMVLQAVGLPTEGIGLILVIDWLLDRFRTTVNVWGDAVGAAVMERYALPPDEGGKPAG